LSVLRGISECYLLLKQAPKARNYLKRATTMSWNSEDADDLEKCWLLLASTFMTVSVINHFKIKFFNKNNLKRVENLIKHLNIVKNV
jgi:hypothetical protein